MLKDFFKKHKNTIEIISVISVIIYGGVEIYNYQDEKSKEKENYTFNYLITLLNNKIPNISKDLKKNLIENYPDKDNNLSSQLVDFLDSANVCIETNSCDREVTKKFICNHNELSTTILHTVAKATMEYAILKVIKEKKMEYEVNKKSVDFLKNHIYMDLRATVYLNAIFERTHNPEYIDFDAIRKQCNKDK